MKELKKLNYNFCSHEKITTRILQESHDYEQLSPVIKNEKFSFKTKNGDCDLIYSPLSPNYLSKITGIYYISNTASKNYIHKILKTDKNSLLAFEINTSFTNVNQLFHSLEKSLF